jgi:hypothetical protein
MMPRSRQSKPNPTPDKVKHVRDNVYQIGSDEDWPDTDPEEVIEYYTFPFHFPHRIKAKDLNPENYETDPTTGKLCHKYAKKRMKATSSAHRSLRSAVSRDVIDLDSPSPSVRISKKPSSHHEEDERIEVADEEEIEKAEYAASTSDSDEYDLRKRFPCFPTEEELRASMQEDAFTAFVNWKYRPLVVIAFSGWFFYTLSSVGILNIPTGATFFALMVYHFIEKELLGSTPDLEKKKMQRMSSEDDED